MAPRLPQELDRAAVAIRVLQGFADGRPQGQHAQKTYHLRNFALGPEDLMEKLFSFPHSSGRFHGSCVSTVQT